MATVREDIMNDIQATLKQILTSNGYNNTIASVQRWSQHEQDFTNLPLIIVVAGSENKAVLLYDRHPGR